MIRHLYLHIPFCTHICPYCAFAKTRNLSAQIKVYLGALRQEMDWARKQFQVHPDTIFWGGGTPTALSPTQLEELFQYWPWQAEREFTIEANPETITSKKADLLLKKGITRVSLGVQAFDQATLQTLGRTHERSTVKRVMKILRDSGHQNISIDLMFNVPGQREDQWVQSIEQAIELNPEHLSTYNLTYEEDTEFYEKLSSGQWQDDDEKGNEFYHLVMERLDAAGYRQYEISNFAKPGYECLHNQSIWEGHDYLGLGTGAVSTISNQRRKNPGQIDAYAQHVASGMGAWEENEVIDEGKREEEQILLGLRTSQGIPFQIISGHAETVDDLRQEGYILNQSGQITLTRKGRVVVDEITKLLI